MRLFFLGTAAAEGFPGIFCECVNCVEARLLGGKNLRFRSALLVNENLLIDFGPDLLASAQRFNKTLARVTTGLITHAHEDHFYTGNFHMRQAAFTGGQTAPTLCLYGPTEVQAALLRENPDLSAYRVAVKTVDAFERWSNDGYTFESFRAFHAVGSLEANFYSVSDDRHSFLYATDTGAFPQETWAALSGKSFDVIILEETMGSGSYTQHIGFETFLEHASRMREEGILRPGSRLIAHHLSHSGNPVHEKVEAILGPYGVEVAYDGLEINL